MIVSITTRITTLLGLLLVALPERLWLFPLQQGLQLYGGLDLVVLDGVYDCFHYNKDYNRLLAPRSEALLRFMIVSITTRITTANRHRQPSVPQGLWLFPLQQGLQPLISRRFLLFLSLWLFPLQQGLQQFCFYQIKQFFSLWLIPLQQGLQHIWCLGNASLKRLWLIPLQQGKKNPATFLLSDLCVYTRING